MEKCDKDDDFGLDYSVAGRNEILYKRLVSEGLVVIRIFRETQDPSVRQIDHLLVSVGVPAPFWDSSNS